MVRLYIFPCVCVCLYIYIYIYRVYEVNKSLLSFITVIFYISFLFNLLESNYFPKALNKHSNTSSVFIYVYIMNKISGSFTTNFHLCNYLVVLCHLDLFSFCLYVSSYQIQYRNKEEV